MNAKPCSVHPSMSTDERMEDTDERMEDAVTRSMYSSYLLSAALPSSAVF